MKLHAALIKWGKNVNKIKRRIPKAFSVVNQKHPVHSRFIVMSITVLNKEVKNSCVYEIKNASIRQFCLHKVAIIAFATLFPHCFLAVFVRSLPGWFMLCERPRDLIEQNTFYEVCFITTNSFGWLAVKTFPVKAESWVVFLRENYKISA